MATSAMKLTLKLEVGEIDKHWVEIDVTDADLKKDPTDMMERLNLAWTAIRNAHRKVQ